MPEYLDDPSSLTKDKLKNELLAHNVELPSGNPTKDVYVQLYLKNLTPQNKQRVTAATLDAFSSDEELPTPVVTNRSRSSGRKATRKTDKTLPDELDVTLLSDGGLRDELLKHGVDVGPIVASTRKLYEKKLQKLLDDGPAQPAATQLVITEIQVNHNGNSESDLYSDKEDEVTPEPEPEPVPVVERLVRSRGKTPVTTRTRSSQHNKRDQLMDEEDHNEDQVLNVKRKSKRLSHRMLHEEDTGLHLPKSNKGSSLRPLALLNSALLEDPEPAVGQSVTALTPAVRSAFYKSKSLPEEHSPQPASKVHPVTFSPMCNISPIKKQESQWCVTEQIGCEAGGGSAAGEDSVPADILPNKRKQQKISSFLSTRSAVKTNSSTSTVSKQMMVEKIAASDQPPKAEESDVLKELFTNDISSPTGINATCRRPIRGAAGRPLKSSDLWNDENSYFSPKTTRTSSNSCTYTENRTVNRVSSLPLSSAPPSSSSSTTSSSVSSYSTSSRLLSAAPPAGQSKAARRGMSLWIKLFLLAIVAAFLFLVYQAMETNTNSPFEGQGTEVSAGSTA